jgi:trans-AT polyketide synthase/acyltransferase/oxidoreductase domain-containing protein
MYKSIASKEQVVAMRKARMMGYLDRRGMDFGGMDAAFRLIKSAQSADQSYRMDVLCNLKQTDLEEQADELSFKHDIRFVGVATIMGTTPSAARAPLTSLYRSAEGVIARLQHTMPKVSRPDVAAACMQPAPEPVVKGSLASAKISPLEAELRQSIPLAGEIYVETGSRGHIDQGKRIMKATARLLQQRPIAMQQ